MTSQPGRLITRREALNQMSEKALDARLGRHWQVVLPGVYATSREGLRDHDRRSAALLHAGPEAMLTDVQALEMYRVPFLPSDPYVRVLVPNHVQRSSRQFVVVRRTTRVPQPALIDGLPVAPLCRALCDFALRHLDERESLAVVAAAVQRGRVTAGALVEEASQGAARGRPRLLRVLEPVQAGIRSAPEQDFRHLVLSRKTLPEPLWNCRLRLPDGREVSPDALWPAAGLVHETNGREFHAGDDLFEDMQRRGDALVAADLTVLNNSPRRIRREGPAVLDELERCYARLDGRGMPPGVQVLRSEASAA